MFMKKKCTLNHAMQEGMLLLLLGGWLLFDSLNAYSKSYVRDWAQSPSLFPAVVSCLLGLFGVIIFCQGMTGKAGETGKGGNALQVLVLLGMSFAYYVALSVIKLPYMALTIGSLTFALSAFEVATVVFLAAVMAFLGVRSRRILILVPVGTSLFLSVMFRTLLRVLLP
jgi:hypothetical protein